VPEENFWTLWCKGRFTEADTLTIQLGATPSGLTSPHLHHPPITYHYVTLESILLSASDGKFKDIFSAILMRNTGVTDGWT